MPMPHYLASRLAERLSAVRHDGTLPYLRPDGKTQVTVRYEDGKPVEVTTIVISTQHAAEIEDMGKIKDDSSSTSSPPSWLPRTCRGMRRHLCEPHRTLCRGRTHGRHGPNRP